MLNMARMEGNITDETNRLFLLVNSCRSLLDRGWNADLPPAPVLASNLKKVAGEEDSNNNQERKKPRLDLTEKKKGVCKDLTPPPDKIKCQFGGCRILFSSVGAAKTHFKVHPDSQYIALPNTVNPATGRGGDKKVRVDSVRSQIQSPFIMYADVSRLPADSAFHRALKIEAG
jgi:hypothetical protein